MIITGRTFTCSSPQLWWNASHSPVHKLTQWHKVKSQWWLCDLPLKVSYNRPKRVSLSSSHFSGHSDMIMSNVCKPNNTPHPLTPSPSDRKSHLWLRTLDEASFPGWPSRYVRYSHLSSFSANSNRFWRHPSNTLTEKSLKNPSCWNHLTYVQLEDKKTTILDNY